MKIYLAADHGGYKLKEEIKDWLKEWGFSAEGARLPGRLGSAMSGEFEDLGAYEFKSDDDYPDFAWPAAVKVGQNPGSFGIFACRSGQGECMVANKAKGVRAAVAWNEKSAFACRNDDDANILCLPADYVTLDTAKKIVHTFLTTPFAINEDRFTRRVNKVKKIDINL